MRSQRLYTTTGLLLAAALAVSVIVVVNAAVTSLRLDLTENRLFTLSEGTRNIIGTLDEPITLDFYFSRKTLSDFPLLMNYSGRVRDLLEEYEAKSGGKIRLKVIEPEPFSEEEDQAVAGGLEGISVNTAGDRGFFGLVGTNSTDDQAVIPFFQTSHEAALEYDITKLIYGLAHPKKRVVGIITGLPMFGFPAMQTQNWAIIDAMREFFEVRDLGPSPDGIDDDIDLIMVVHPKDLKEDAKYAIDQYLLAGRNAMLFVDPLAEADTSRPDPDQPGTIPDLDSDLKYLFTGWGIEVLEEKVAGDIAAAMRVQTRGERGPEETYYLPWLRLGPDNLSQDDFTTSELEVIHMGTAGIIEKRDNSPLRVTPLIQTSTRSMAIERDLIFIQRDPNVMLQNFSPENKKLTLAARLSGTVPTAFPDGPPGGADKDAQAKFLKEGKVNLFLIADTDVLTDNFWIRKQNFFGIDIPQSIANNGDFLINAVDNLSGSTDLISLRSRGEYSRPFVVVEEIRLQAEQQFREQEQALQNKLKETEKKILELQNQGGEGSVILSPEQTREIERFRDEEIKTRKELRSVQHELQKNIERLGARIKFANIGLMPILIALLALGAGLYRVRRRPD